MTDPDLGPGLWNIDDHARIQTTDTEQREIPAGDPSAFARAGPQERGPPGKPGTASTASSGFAKMWSATGRRLLPAGLLRELLSASTFGFSESCGIA